MHRILPILWIICILLSHLVLLTTTRFTLWPEMVVYPYLINNGFELYRDIINPYTPIFANFLSFFSQKFGYDPIAYQLLTWAIVIVVDISIYKISRKIFNSQIFAFSSLIFFVIVSQPFGVNGLWYDLVQTPFILLSFYFVYLFLAKPKNLKYLLASSLLLALAFFIKQQIIWLYIWLTLIVLLKFKSNLKKSLKSFSLIFMPPLMLGILNIAFFYSKGILSDFLFWVLYFPFIIASKMPGYLLLPTKRQLSVLLVLIAIFIPVIRNQNKKSRLILTTSIFLLPFAYPRFDYFHLIPFLAIISLALGPNLKLIIKSKIISKLAFMSLVTILSFITARYILNNYKKEVRFFEKDIYTSSHLLSLLSTHSDRIYIQNGPDQIFVIANRLPTKPWAIQFPWYLEVTHTQSRILQGIKESDPKFVISKPYSEEGKYEIGSYRPQNLGNYLDSNYKNLVQMSDTLWLKIRRD